MRIVPNGNRPFRTAEWDVSMGNIPYAVVCPPVARALPAVHVARSVRVSHARHRREDTMTTAIRHSFAATALAALFAVALSGPGLAQQKFKALSVKTPDGLTIAAQEWGNPNGPEILFIHGFSQSGMSWTKQVNSDLAKEFHMVTYDLRGHGNSDKPLEPERYRNGKAWADEVQAVMDAAGFKRAVMVGWSYGGRVMADYLTNYGTSKLAGLDYVDAGQKGDPAFVGPNLKNLPLMASEDLATNIAATREFLHGCFNVQPTQDEYETMLAFNMMVPPKVRAGLSGRPLEVDELLKSIRIPVLVTHGALDRNSNLIAAEYTAKMIPGAKLSVYQGVGHSPFFEDAPRFNAELAAFVRSAQKVN
jgi:non-heme chloroperoxidase